MGRFQVLEKAINKGTQINERSNEQISNWSPNNIRRLIIGADFAMIHYFVASGKVTKTVEIVDFRCILEGEMKNLATSPDKYRSILGVITDGRILSSIEEIIFCTQGYPQPMLNMDIDGINKLAGGNTSLDTRFPRLRHISQSPVNVRQLAEIKGLPKEGLFLDSLRKHSIQLHPLVEQHKEDWWKGLSLRPKYYKLDEDVLKSYFDKVRASNEEKLREEKLDSLSSQQNMDLVKRSIPSLGGFLSNTYTLLDKSTVVFKTVSFLSKAEWANVLDVKSMFKGIRKELIKQEDAINQYRRIDFEKIVSVSKEAGIPDETVRMVQGFEKTLFESILGNEPQYKRDSNKLSLSDSINSLVKVASTVFRIEVNIIYLAFAKYLSRNTPEYAPFFYEKVETYIPDVQYSRGTMEFCNHYLEKGVAKSCMDKIRAVEIPVDAFNVQLRYTESKKLLDGLVTVR